MKTVPLGEVAEFIRGVTFKPGDVVDVGTAGSVACMRTKNVQLELDLSDVYAVPLQVVKRDEQYLQIGDVLISSANSWNLLGKCSWVGELPWQSSFGGFVTALRGTSDLVDPRYLYRWFSFGNTQQLLRSFGRKTTNISNLPLDRCRKIEFPLPPIEEQRRIAAVLDAADALRAKRRQALAKLDTLTQAIFIDMFGDPIRSDRPHVPLGDIVTFTSGGTPSKKRPDFFEGEICWATSKDMKFRFLDDTQDHVTIEAISSSATKLVPTRTVLVVVKSKVLAHSLPVSITRVEVCFGQDLKGLVPKEGFSAEFVATALSTSAPWLLRRARGVNTEGLTLEQLRRCPVPESTPESRRSFANAARKVEASFEEYLRSGDMYDQLFASLQQRAFRGEL